MPRYHTPALALAIATLAVTAAPAAAMPIDPPLGRSAPTADAPARPPQVQSTDTGVDWGSAALGGGVVAIVGLGSIGAGAITGRRRMRTTR